MKFIHAGDIHLGNKITTKNKIPGWLETLFKEYQTQSFQEMIKKAIDNNIDFIVMSGNLFNSNNNWTESIIVKSFKK